ncbi:HAMP domain-containing sensor histidine kinase [Rhodanobacter sp. L36]|uniref:sensor histidine kinase n=1 Tax=Rhodanobacter sp. L36 TaxID=1747221 RepID=UPI00131DE86B|nr:HAMP domain-containing sensor histidine kinase [Rhodanobacter sp. L36]
MESSKKSQETFHAGAFHQRIAWVFGLQLVAMVIVCTMGIYDVAPWAAVIAVIVITSTLAWMATRREWLPVSTLAKLINGWDEKPDLYALSTSNLSPRTDADLASLARGLHGFASRIAVFNQRERNFTRDASHELRSPLTVIKMSVDMLSEERDISEFGARSVRRIKRASLEMEALVEALLILARESDPGADTERFVVNDVLVRELAAARELLSGRPIELQLEEPARFALEGSSRAFSVLCWQVIRNACQQTDQGRVLITVLPGVVSVSNHASPQAADNGGPLMLHGADRHGFELAIAQRISDRFAWPLELQTRPGYENIARIHFPHPLPA